MSDITIYHNPRCSKSRQTLALLEEKGGSPTVVEYLKEMPSKAELKNVLSKLGLSAREVLRKGEADYKASGANDASISEDALLDKIISYPKLLERPIVIKGKNAVLGRPPENVLKLLN